MQYKWTALGITTIATLMSTVDGRIVVIGLPTIAQQLHAGAAELIWITQAYLVAQTVGLLLIGRIADIFGRVKLFNAGFIIFTLGSALSALSSNSDQLIAFRLVQGVGAGILTSSSTVIITDAASRNELGTLLGINQIAFQVGALMGLTLAGIILSVTDWRGLFYVNVPIGIIGSVLGYVKLREIAEKDVTRKMDWPGFAVFALGLTLVLLAITFLSYGISNWVQGFGFLFLGLALLAIFVKIESISKSPLLDLSLFKIRLFAMSNVSQLLNAMTWGGLVLLLALYLQLGLGYTPLQSGLAIIPLEVTFIFCTYASGRLSDKYGSRFLSTSGLVLIAVGFVVLGTFGATTPYLLISIALVILGAGNGTYISPNTRATMAPVPENRRGIASGFKSLMFMIGFTASYGLVVLFISFGVSYTTFSALLQGTVPTSALALSRLQFLSGFRIACLAMAVIDVAAIIPSVMRGTQEFLSHPAITENAKSALDGLDKTSVATKDVDKLKPSK